MKALDRVTAALEAAGCSQQGRDWTCPAHEDRSASLSVSNGNGAVLLHCHAGCPAEAVVAAARLTMAELFDEPAAKGNGRREVESYGYVDEAGAALFEVVRFDPKDFRQRRPDGVWSLKGVRRVPYRLPQVLEAAGAGATVYIAEGERDVHALERVGAVATCNPGGAGKWRPEYSPALKGADVVVIADRDTPGRDHAAQVARALTGVAKSVRVVEAAAGKDAADHLAAGHTLDDFRPVEITADEIPSQARPVQHAVSEITFDDKGKLQLPPVPEDPSHRYAWLTAALAFDKAHPVIRCVHEGSRGAAGHVVLERLDAPPLRIEPASRINTPMRLIEDRTWQAITSDEPTPAYKADHCRLLAHVIRQACGAETAMSDRQETEGIVIAYLGAAQAIEGHTTYGTAPQRYEAAVALRRDVDDTTGRPIGAARYLLDANTGEFVIRVADLNDVARRFVGSGLARGWLDARMTGAGWQRVRLDGHAEPGRAGRGGLHARCDTYRGHFGSDQAVTT